MSVDFAFVKGPDGRPWPVWNINLHVFSVTCRINKIKKKLYF